VADACTEYRDALDLLWRAASIRSVHSFTEDELQERDAKLGDVLSRNETIAQAAGLQDTQWHDLVPRLHVLAGRLSELLYDEVLMAMRDACYTECENMQRAGLADSPEAARADADSAADISADLGAAAEDELARATGKFTQAEASVITLLDHSAAIAGPPCRLPSRVSSGRYRGIH
jgi:hypothetical protein